MIKELSQSRGAVCGFEITGKVSTEEERAWTGKLEKAAKDHGKLRILVVLGEEASWGLKAGAEDIGWILTHLKNIEKIAIVSSSAVWKWLVSVDALFAPLVGIGEKHFDTAELASAWEWIREPRR